MLDARRAVLVVLALSLGLGCKKEPAPTIEPDRTKTPAPSTSSASTTALAPAPIAPPKVGDCLPERFRTGELEAAWMEAGAIAYCVNAPDYGAGTRERACFAVDLGTGVTRTTTSTTIAKKPPPVKGATFAKSSLGGAFTFDLKGGLRSPKGASVTLTDTKTKTTKRAPLDYDEHVAYDGWLGDAVVLRTWVDEGPGCGRSLHPVMKTWPIVLDGSAIALESCYDTLDLVFDTKRGKKALIDGDGGDLVLVEPGTLTITRVASHRVGGGPGELTAFTPTAEEVVVLFRAPITGDFVRYDLTKEAIVSEATARMCEDTDAGAVAP